MRQSTRRRLTRGAATGLVLGLGGGLLSLSAPLGAANALAADNVSYSANSSGTILHVSALDAHPLGVNLGPLVDLKVSTAGNEVNSKTTPRSKAAASHLDLGVNVKLPDTPAGPVSQTAPPDNPEPVVSNPAPLNLGVGSVGIGHLLAHARWNPSCETPTGPTQLANSSTSLANLALLPGSSLAGINVPVPLPVGQSTSTVELPNIAYADSASRIVDVDGQDTLGVQAQARVSLAQVILFGGTSSEIQIKVISAPKLTVTAAGTERSNVKYEAPILEITANGSTQRLDSPHAVVEIPLVLGSNAAPAPKMAPAEEQPNEPLEKKQSPGDLLGPVGDILEGGLLGGLGNGGLLGGGGGGSAPMAAPATEGQQGGALLRISIADVVQTIKRSHVKAEASSVRLQVLDVPGKGSLLDVALGQLKAEAKVPHGGIVPPGQTPTPTPSDNAGGGPGGGSKGGLPVTGVGLTGVLGAAAVLIIVGRIVMLAARRRSNAEIAA